MATLITPFTISGTSEEDLMRWQKVNNVLKHSVGVYDNVQYGYYKANVTDNGDGTMNVDMTLEQDKDYITMTTDNGDGTMNINVINIKDGD